MHRPKSAAAVALVTAAVVAAAAGCASTSRTTVPGRVSMPEVTRGVAAVEPTADPRPFGASDTAFGLNVLRAWCTAEPADNLVFSPSTLASALGMAYLGARGATARAIATVLRLPAKDAAVLTAGLQARTKGLGAAGGPGVTLVPASQVWADPKLPPLASYLNAVATGYAAGLNQVPLLTDPTRAAQQINYAVSQQTRGHIPRLVTADMLADVGWVLTSALYMDARWAKPFDPAQTTTGTFTAASGTHVSARFMNSGGLPFATSGGWTAVSLPYRGGKLTMTALLPPAGSGECVAPGTATLGTLTAQLARTGAGAPGAAISLPKVSLRSSAKMNGVLTSLGMGTAFSPGVADFTGLSPAAGFIKFVQQAATLQVGEKGTTGSAAVAIGIEPTSGTVISHLIVFDRPYLMLVTDKVTGEPLFLARVADPAV
ncbi:MAG TPA: serpin family protein [Streptosporangiaceae bacterium]